MLLLLLLLHLLVLLILKRHVLTWTWGIRLLNMLLVLHVLRLLESVTILLLIKIWVIYWRRFVHRVKILLEAILLWNGIRILVYFGLLAIKAVHIHILWLLIEVRVVHLVLHLLRKRLLFLHLIPYSSTFHFTRLLHWHNIDTLILERRREHRFWKVNILRCNSSLLLILVYLRHFNNSFRLLKYYSFLKIIFVISILLRHDYFLSTCRIHLIQHTSRTSSV